MAENTTSKRKSMTKVTNTVDESTTSKSFSPSQEIECISVTAGELIMIGKKTKNLYRWTGYGDSAMVEYQDLKAEKLNKLSQYIYDPLFMINDEELLATSEFSSLNDLYGSFMSIDDIDDIFDLDNGNFKRVISGLPIGIKNAIKSVAATKIMDGSLDSIKKIKILDEVLGTSLYSFLDA